MGPTLPPMMSGTADQRTSGSTPRTGSKCTGRATLFGEAKPPITVDREILSRRPNNQGSRRTSVDLVFCACRVFITHTHRWGLARGAVSPYARTMIIRSVRHRGLRQLIEHDNPRFLRADLVDRVRRILTLLVLAEDHDGFLAHAPRGWRVHRLSGNRQQEWSISISRNWRMTFEEHDGFIDRLNLEDYH